MVALNTAYAAPKNVADLKNRVGDFFYEDHASVGKNRWASRLNAQEKSCYHYEAASGRSNWPNRDPLHEFAFQYLEIYQPESLLEVRYGFVGNDPVNQWDLLGLKIIDDGPDDDIKDMLDDLFDSLDKKIDTAFNKCQSKTGCIGSKSKCETCCGLAGAGLTLTATGKHWTARARCTNPIKNARTAGFHFFQCIAEAAVKYGEVLTKIKDKTDSCRTSCPCRDSDCSS